MKTIITTAIAFFICSVTFGQIKSTDMGHTKKADRLFDKWEYYEAAKEYEDVAKDNPSPDVYYKLGQCYQKMFRFQEAVDAYDKVNSYGSFNQPDFYLNYGLVLKANGRYDDARAAFMKYDSMASNDSRGKFYANSCDVVLDDLQKPMPVTVSNVESINTSDAAFGAAMYDGGIVFASNSASSTGHKTFPWTGKSYLDLVYAKRGSSDTEFSGTSSFAGEVNENYHDGPASFTKNYDTIYFSRVSRELKGSEKRTLKVERSKIYYSVLKDGKWSEEKPFTFNNDSFGVFTPYVSSDGTRLYFASDMPGGMGQTDIYYCVKDGQGWSKPINVGPAVNTFGREQFPSLDAEGNLYFASDGYMGYGGLDMCVSKIAGGSFQHAEVLKAPLNSPDNEYGITFLKSQKSGYISSARKEGKGDADIYYFNLEKDSLPCEVNTTNYVIGFECPKKEEVAEAHNDSIKPVTVVDNNLAGLLILPVYFDFDKSDIRPDAINNLDSVIRIMKAHPGWNMKISGNADCRGSNEYNIALSQRRANSVVKYLSARGISTSRLQTMAYGESKLVNHCSDGVPCSEGEHQQNRRVEFTVIVERKDVGVK
jgi:outer membrane protein OmpA-like peptidoglycan-associated protein